MKTLIPERVAANGIVLLLLLVVIFHGCIMLGIIPYEMVWGGRLQSQSQMLLFEAVSIILNLLMLTLIAIKAGYLKININQTFLRAALWFMAALFTLNTLGNLFSVNELEKMIFTPLTFLLAVFCFRLAISKKSEPQTETIKSN